MQVLGQHVEVGDVLRFPVAAHRGDFVWSRVERISPTGLTAFDADGNSFPLDFDVHVSVK